ncbi:hypothetical protein D3C85_1452660 [compost metagenome]
MTRAEQLGHQRRLGAEHAPGTDTQRDGDGNDARHHVAQAEYPPHREGQGQLQQRKGPVDHHTTKPVAELAGNRHGHRAEAGCADQCQHAHRSLQTHHANDVAHSQGLVNR